MGEKIFMTKCLAFHKIVPKVLQKIIHGTDHSTKNSFNQRIALGL